MSIRRNNSYLDYRKSKWAVRVQKIREGLGLTQQQLADQLGVHLSTVQCWVWGRKQPSGLAKIDLERLEKTLPKTTAAAR